MLLIRTFRALLIASTGWLLLAQLPPAPAPVPEPEKNPEVRLPNGRLQRDEILKLDHAKNLEDARALVKLSDALRTDLESSTEHVLSISDLKKTEEIEKLARRIRARMKRN